MTKFSRHTQIGLNASTLCDSFVTELYSRLKTKDIGVLQDPNILEFVKAPTPKATQDFIKDLQSKLPIEEANRVASLLRQPVNKNIYFSQNALNLVDNIKLKKDFDINFLNNIPNNTMETFLLGTRFYRFWRVDNKLVVLHYQRWKKLSDFNLESDFEKAIHNGFLSRFGSEQAVEKHLKGEGGQTRVLDNTLMFGIDFNADEVIISGNQFEILDQFLQMLIFLRYGDVTINLVKANSVTKVDGVSVSNETSKDITVVKANWNTISIRTEGFSVSAHLRLQPCGEGRKDRKLILINEFEKKRLC